VKVLCTFSSKRPFSHFTVMVRVLRLLLGNNALNFNQVKVLHCIVQCRELRPYPEELDNN